MDKLFAVVIKLTEGKHSGKLEIIHMFGDSEEQLKRFILICGLQPILISEEW